MSNADEKKDDTIAGELELPSRGERLSFASKLEIRAQSTSAPVKPGDIVFKAGAFLGGVPLPITDEHGGAIIFKLGDETEVLRFAPDGKIYIRGVLVQDERAAWEGLRIWLVAASVLFPGDAHVGKSS